MKHSVFTLIIFSFIFLLLEGSSFILLKFFLKDDITIDYYEGDKLLDHAPAQLRLTNDEIRAFFPREAPFKKVGNFMSFPSDPVLGFMANEDDRVTWFNGDIDSLDGKFLVLTFGGSTTVKDNWPKYLVQYAQEAGIKEDLVILNAGHWGYMTFLEKIYFTSWILPEFEERNIKPDLVLSLDGVNDVWTRLMGYFEHKNNRTSKWFNHYHGYHQQLDTDLKELGTLRTSFNQFLSSAARNSYTTIIYYLVPIVPYTVKAALELSRRIIQPIPSKTVVEAIAKLEKYRLSDKDENKIVAAHETSLHDFWGASNARNIDFVGYLQPILLPEYHPFDTPESISYPSIDYYGVNFSSQNKLWSRFDQVVVDTSEIYKKLSKMYDQLNRKHPGSFTNLIDLFYDIPHTAELYNRDAIHYNTLGKRMIAKAVISDLISKNILTRQ